MVCLVVNGDSLPFEADLVDYLQTVPGMTSIVLNENTERTNVILGRKLRTLWGRDEIEDTLQIYTVDVEDAKQQCRASCCTEVQSAVKTTFIPTGETVTFRISPLSFYQVNPEQTQKLL